MPCALFPAFHDVFGIGKTETNVEKNFDERMEVAFLGYFFVGFQ